MYPSFSFENMHFCSYLWNITIPLVVSPQITEINEIFCGLFGARMFFCPPKAKNGTGPPNET